jgi:ABC-type oligopeptide transport system substrate-binding subunit
VARDKADLYDPELAASLIGEAVKKAGGQAQLTLKYPAGDPVLAAALADLAGHARKAGLEITLAERSPEALRAEVEARDYELAYYRYDFPDETLWLTPLLGPKGPLGRGNVFGYAGARLQTDAQQVLGRRDFAQARDLAHTLHDAFLRDMPFVPLWQLDPLHALRNTVEAPPFDPLLLFTDAERWRRK